MLRSTLRLACTVARTAGCGRGIGTSCGAGAGGGESGWKAAHVVAPQGGGEVSAGVKGQLTRRQRRAIYRSKQRGLLELDILLGQWAVRHVPSIESDDELRKLETLLDEDSPHLLSWVLNKSEPPAHVDAGVVKSLREFALADHHVLDR